jgi:hypothetical protein
MGAWSIVLCNDCKEHDPTSCPMRHSKDDVSAYHSTFLEKHSGHDIRIMSDAHGQFSAQDWDYDKKTWSDEFWKNLIT